VTPSLLGAVVICSYRPKAGKQPDLVKALEAHVPTLRRLGFATEYPRTLVVSPSGDTIEIFEWVSEEAHQKAGEYDEVRQLWDEIERLADSVPLAAFPETQKPFAHFVRLKTNLALPSE
jgi:hypothetical protein